MNLKGQLEMELGIMSALETVSLIRYWVKAGSAKARTELVQYEVVRDVRSGNVVKGWRQVRKQAWADSERSGCWKRAGLLHREGVEVAEDHWLGYAMDDQVLGL